MVGFKKLFYYCIGGEILAIVLMDISEEQNLEELAKRLQSVIDTAIDGVITIDQEGYVESINKAGADLFGYEPEEVIGEKINMLMPSKYAREHDGYLHHYHRTGEERIIGIGREVEGKRKNGSVFPFRLAVSEVRMKERTIYTGIVHDISDIKEAQGRVMKLNRELEEKVEERTNELETVVNRLLKANRVLHKQEEKLQRALDRERELSDLKSRFVSTASHEFRTPLSTILSSASLIEKYSESDQQGKREKHINRIKSAVANLTDILDDFLSLSRIEEGKVDAQIKEFSINDLMDEVMEELKPIKKEKQNLVLEGLDDSDIMLQSDPKMIKNIFINLLSNAIKYSESGLIRCTVNMEGEEFEIEVEDQGMGIPEKEQKHLFERFFRASNATNTQGTGLGLNIVRQYVDCLGGQISFESEEGEGTTFTLKIPKTAR